ncbi:hypothetical protein HETIRDRAFT_174249 [Heterobasidion irregulare TC 32-1]|uniref:Uncharacterized protein n=1 Tax=Heterobasidion irregulare (strain TC 32-1) TaxID=747525 RepID=W4JVK0_HETIT|nr:uncharacterized protein HETIRDRAFT_174249 [Heterobasidion irregulare TC 32-1]ETW77105.1 hypothetical protein HETIRDRAFT_174249 [Heterobasidion irregulare TC 32-1]
MIQQIVHGAHRTLQYILLSSYPLVCRVPFFLLSRAEAYRHLHLNCQSVLIMLTALRSALKTAHLLRKLYHITHGMSRTTG